MIQLKSSKHIWSVSGVTNYIKELFDTDPNLQGIVVKGEVSNFHHHSSGHMYFTLKDKKSQLSGVMFRSNAQRVDFDLEDGMEVIVEGEISLYSVRGQYQIYVKNIQPDGIGALHIAYEQLKEKLSKEGLFNEEWKRSIPKIPARVGVITSATGAAIRDIIRVIKRRFSNVSLLIAPATVQGERAEKSLIKGLNLLNKEDVDVIIIGRGGGSIEDLWAFNKEGVARAIFNSEIPVISAVGHERDFTISDFVADVRAATPSAAAELVVSNQEEVRKYLVRLETNLTSLMKSKLNQLIDRLDYLAQRRAFDLVGDKVRDYGQHLDELSNKLELKGRENLVQKEEKLKVLTSQLESLSPLNVLNRGYSIARKVEDKEEIKSINQLKEGDGVEVILKDGIICCRLYDKIYRSKKNKS